MTTSTGTARTPDGAVLAWTKAGAGEPVVLIAGQAVSMQSWDPVVPLLVARGFRVLTFDHRGIGDSTEGSDPPTTTRGFAADLAIVLDAADVPSAHVVGHSMGGRVAQWFALDHPERVRDLVLISTTGGDSRHPRSAAATADLAAGDAARLAARFFTQDHLAQHPDAAEVFLRREGSVRTRRRHFGASSTHDTWNRLGEIVAPTLVVHGSDDTITLPASGRDLAAAIPDAEYVEVLGERHAPQLGSAPTMDRIVKFFRR